MSVLIPLCYSNTAFIETKIEQLLSFQMNTEKLSIHVMLIAILKTKKNQFHATSPVLSSTISLKNPMQLACRTLLAEVLSFE